MLGACLMIQLLKVQSGHMPYPLLKQTAADRVGGLFHVASGQCPMLRPPFKLGQHSSFPLYTCTTIKNNQLPKGLLGPR